MEDDGLAQCRLLYYVGMYDACSSRCARQLVAGQLAQQEKEGLVYACRLQQAFQQQGGFPPDELQRLATSNNSFLRSLALYCLFLEAKSHSERMGLYQQLRDTLQHHCNSFSAFFTSCAAAALQRFTEALDITAQVPVLEMQVLRVQHLLLMNRGELAAEAAEKMVAQDDDCCMGKLASALVYTVQGNPQEASYFLRDIEMACLQEGQPNPSSLLIVGKAAAHLQRRRWTDCFRDATEAYQLTPCNTEALVNLICCCRNMRKHRDADFFFERLKSVAPTHHLVQKMNELDVAFSNFRLASSVAGVGVVPPVGQPLL